MGNTSSYVRRGVEGLVKGLRYLIPSVFNSEGKIVLENVANLDDGTFIVRNTVDADIEESDESDEIDESDESDTEYEDALDIIDPSNSEFQSAESEVNNVMRLNVTTYGDLIYRLETILELNPEMEYKFFNLQIHYRLLGDRLVCRTESRNLKNMRIRDMFNTIREQANMLEERYNLCLIHTDEGEEEEVARNLICAFLTELSPVFGKGNKNFNFVFTLNNELWSVVFPETRSKCLIECVYNILGKPKTDRFFKNTSFKSKTYEQMLALIKENLGFNVRISQTLETVKHDLQHREPKTIYLYSKNCHTGYLTKGIEEYAPIFKKADYPRFVSKSECIRIGYDCEYSYKLIDGVHVPQKSNLVCCAIKSNNFVSNKAFNSFNKMIIYVEQLAIHHKMNVYCYAHNAQKVENPFMLQEIVRMKQLKECAVYNFNGNKIKSYNYSISVTEYENKVKKVKRYSIYFIDTLCYVKQSLENIVDMFQLTTTKGHNKMPETMTENEKNEWYLNKRWDINDPDDVDYCMRDATICSELTEVLNDFAIRVLGDEIQTIYKSMKGNKKCDFDDLWILNRTSMASVCRTIFHNLYPEILNTSEDASLFKIMYYGGRNECFYIGPTDEKYRVCVMDINSAYPYQMSKGFAGKYIGDCVYLGVDLNIDSILGYANNGITSLRWCAFIKLRYKKMMKFPLFAINREGKLLFPNIKNYTLIPVWDVEYEAIKDNLDIDSIEYAGFFESCSMSKHIKKLSDIKKSAKDKALKSFAKVTLNSIYGINGMDNNRPVKKLVKKDIDLDRDIFSTDYIISEGFDDYQWIQYRAYTDVSASFHSASSITAQARLQLWEMITYADNLGLKCLYCDTDSVMFLCDKDYDVDYNFKKFMHPTEFGMWDCEFHDKMHVFTNKVYYYKDGEKFTKKFKGLNDGNSIDPSMIYKDCKFNVTGTKVTRQLTVENYNIVKKFSLEYSKGIVEQNGDVTPFIF